MVQTDSLQKVNYWMNLKKLSSLVNTSVSDSGPYKLKEKVVDLLKISTHTFFLLN